MTTKTRLASAFSLVLLTCPASHAQPAVIDIKDAPIPIRILAQSPADTTTDLQAICLFRSSPVNALHGSLAETNEKLKGLLERIRTPELFGGELGETLLIAPPQGGSPPRPLDSLGAKKLLIIGLGDSQSFSPQRMQLVGEILYTEASRIGVAHPFFAPTILDGGVAKFTTGEVAEQAIRGFLRAFATHKILQDAKASASPRVTALTYLAGAQNVSSTREGIERAISAPSPK